MGMSNTNSNAVLSLIGSTVRAAAAARLHKGNIQDAVSTAVYRATGRRFLTLVEAAHAHRVLVSTGYEAPCGFKAVAS